MGNRPALRADAIARQHELGQKGKALSTTFQEIVLNRPRGKKEVRLGTVCLRGEFSPQRGHHQCPHRNIPTLCPWDDVLGNSVTSKTSAFPPT